MIAANGIPSGWDRRQIGQCASVKRGASPRPIEDPKWWGGEIGWVRISDVTSSRKYLTKTRDYLSEEGVRNSVQIKVGEVILSICATIGRPIITTVPVCIHDGFVWFKGLPDDIHREYLYYYLASKEAELANSRQTGTQGNLNTTIVSKLELLLPSSRAEQAKIAEILSTIDRAIGQTEASIAKQQRIKTGLMQDLLTRGIDAHGNVRSERTHKFKDSSLGLIPVEWEVQPCIALCKQIVVGIVIRPVQYYKPDGVPVLRSANVRENRIDPSNLVFMSEKDNETLSKSQLYTGDLVTVRTGYPGTTAVVPSELDGSNCVDVVISRPNPDRIRSEFLSIWINSDDGKRQVLEGQGGLAQQHFNVGEMKSLLVKTPSLAEQQRIEEVLIQQRSMENSILETLRKLIVLKTALAQDLLTGKRRVTPLLESEPNRENMYANS
jgi:type I restriction enzyme S subunit